MESHRILLIGSGGREHALALALSGSPQLETLYIAPGNPGTDSLGVNVDIDLDDFESILSFIEEHEITLTVIGPEKPLVDGLVDFLEDEEKLVFGPSKDAARLEGSKSFAKDIMHKYSIPTADYVCFERHEWSQAVEHVNETQNWPRVLKADGLAAGKGVFVCENKEEALEALEMMQNDPNLSGASYRLVIEEFLVGEEVSVFAICDGNSSKIMFHAQDHKRIGDGDTGLNTGGMGAYGPAPVLDVTGLKEVNETIVKPMINAMANEGMPYKGVLYVGLMMTASGPKVVEFNCRFGDPECQVIVPALKSDFIEMLLASVHGKLDYIDIEMDSSYYTCIVLSSKGYPLSYEKGNRISGNLENRDDIWIFHCGTKTGDDGILYTNGGRVLNVVAKGDDLKQSINRAYQAVGEISFEGMYYRKDIGEKGLKRVS